MEFRVLGPLELYDQGQTVDLGAPRVRTVCGILLVRPGDLVAVEQFVDELWPDRPPADARALVRGYVSRLRRVLRSGPTGADRLVARKPGYLLRIEPDELDQHRFERLVGEARAARKTDPGRGAELFRQAHQLWRGTPFADVPRTASIAAAATALTEQRLTTREEWFDAALAAGQHADVSTDLAEFVTANPLRERSTGQLMLALYRCGRQAEALAQFQRIRRSLVEEVGVDPGTDLQDLHQRILNADPTLAAVPVRTTALPVPAELPAEVTDFVGREGELKQLRGLLDGERGAVAVLTGSAGVGKTALALHWAHSLAGQFTDGRLYANLRGYGPGEPESTATVLARFLRALGVHTDALPAAVDELAGLFRSMLAGKRVLILLDNARDTAQVRALLPGTPRCLVVVTSRDDLPGLVVRDGARRVEVTRFSPGQALDLFSRILGAETTTARLTEFERLADRCAHLPLALRVIAERLLWRPASLTDLLTDLASDTRLDLLGGEDDPDSAVRAVFSWSYRLLPAEPARLFRLLGAWPGPDADLPTAAALIGATPRATRQAVETLARAHLVEEPVPGRITMHDLLRAYAAELAAELEPAADLHAALNRHCGMATACMDLVDPHRRRVPPPTGVEPREVADAEDALAWLDAEHRNLVALTRYAAANGLLGHAWYLPHTLSRFFLYRHHIEDWIDIGRTALDAACRLDDPFAEAETRTHLASAHINCGRTSEALDHYRLALPLHRRSGNTHGEAVILGNVGAAHHRRGEFEDAVTHYQDAVTLLAEVGDHRNESIIVANLAGVLNLLGRHEESVVAGTRALDLGRQTDDDGAQGHALRMLGIAHRELGHGDEAAEHLDKALAIARSLRDEADEGLVLSEIARLHGRQGDHRKAMDLHTRALDIARQTDDPGPVAVTLLALGEATVAAGDPRTALGLLHEALDLAVQTEDRHHEELVRQAIARTEDVD